MFLHNNTSRLNDFFPMLAWWREGLDGAVLLFMNHIFLMLIFLVLTVMCSAVPMAWADLPGKTWAFSKENIFFFIAGCKSNFFSSTASTRSTATETTICQEIKQLTVEPDKQFNKGRPACQILAFTAASVCRSWGSKEMLKSKSSFRQVVFSAWWNWHSYRKQKHFCWASCIKALHL